ncbi:ribbon-helix-helix protein, CopG family [Candidatus Gottesmanbacteria bacterium]|nr:ribbon-helix-helix protein, CopG family [Candidatus Gottesmanbacteria bacterium]
MNRYQIYLDPNDVNVFDRLSHKLDMSRSQIIRDVLSRVAREYKKLLTATYGPKSKNNPLLKMAGIIKGTSKNLSEDVDSIYFRD